MNLLLRLTLIAAFPAICCPAQTATVTFYSQPITAKSEAKVFVPYSEQPFGGLLGGWVLDGPQRLARVRTGRFVTFHLTPGKHSFSDVGPTGSSKTPLVMDAKDGGHYCVRLFSKMTTGGWENYIEEVPCERAQREAAHLKRIDIKRVDPSVAGEFDSAATFPSEIKPQPLP